MAHWLYDRMKNKAEAIVKGLELAGIEEANTAGIKVEDLYQNLKQWTFNWIFFEVTVNDLL